MTTATRPAAARIAGTVSLVVLAIGLLVTAADLPMAWVVWPLGYGVALPLAVSYGTRHLESGTADAEPDPLAEVRQRYVDGEIGEAEFEAEIESALEREGTL